MEPVYDAGIYLLEIYLDKNKDISIGRKGLSSFPAGYYYYVGTAQRNLRARLERHQRQEKKHHWHIDYLLAEADLRNYYTWPVDRSGECRLADYLQDLPETRIILPGFGASDCQCTTHLFYVERALSGDLLSGQDFSSKQ